MNTWKGLNCVSDPLIQTLFRIRLILNDRSRFQLDNKTIELNKGWKKAFHSRWVGRLTGWIRTSPLRGSVLILRSDTPPPAMNILFKPVFLHPCSCILFGLGSYPCFQLILNSCVVQLGAVKLVLCSHWMHLSYMHQWRQRTNFIAPSCTLLVRKR